MKIDKLNIIIISGVIIISLIVIVLFNPVKISGREKSVPAKIDKKFRYSNNPLYKQFLKIGKRYKLDLSYTKNVKYYYKWRTFDSAIFCHEPGSLDIIIFGDSTVGWGLIPQVVEEISGLKIGVFALRGMYCNKRTLAVLKKIRNYYLKKDGLSIFAFDLWTQTKSPHIFRREDELHTLSKLNKSEFADYCNKKYFQCNGKSLKSDDHQNSESKFFNYTLFSMRSFKNYNSKIKNAELFLSDEYGLSLPRKTILSKTISEISNPDWYLLKQSEEEDVAEKENYSTKNNPYKIVRKGSVGDIKKWILVRWDSYSTTLYQKRPPRRSIHSSRPGKNIFISKNLKDNSKAMIAFPGRKAYLITFYNNHKSYVTARGYYKKLYKDHFSLIDLGKIHPKNKRFNLDKVNHTINTSGLYKSIFIGQWLKKQKGN